MDSPLCENNVLLIADSYKVTHHLQYPPNTTHVFSYFESRGGAYDRVVFFGLQAIIKKYLSGPVVTMEKIQEAQELYKLHFGGHDYLNVDGWRRIVEVHRGCLPLRIRAVPEGTVVPTKNVLFTVENTDEALPWLTNWFETLLVQAWYPMTVATNSRAWKVTIAQFLLATAPSAESLPFRLHDFGFRGVSSVETAQLGGAAHLVNFSGTDTIAGLVCARNHYHACMAGFSIPAAEHSTVTSWGRGGEVHAYANMLDQFPDTPMACVSDSYNIWEAISKFWGGELREKVMARTHPLVIRPDSGIPHESVVQCLVLMGLAFPPSINARGYYTLPPYIRLIQGDGVDADNLFQILRHMAKFKWSAENVTFGSGGALLQKLHRDTLKCAFKCAAAVVGGEHRRVYKSPIGDAGKKSKMGYLTLERDGDTWCTVEHASPPADASRDQLQTVFENGRVVKDHTFEEVRDRAKVLDCECALDLPAHTCSGGVGHLDGACPACTWVCGNATCVLCDISQWGAWLEKYGGTSRGAQAAA